MVHIPVAGFVYVAGLYVLSVGLPLWVAWKTRHGDVRILGICVRGWVGPWAVIASVCAVIFLVTQLPGLSADHDALALVGFFFFGVVVCAIFPLSLLVGRGILAVPRILRGRWVNSDGTPEIIWLLISVGVCAVVYAAVALRGYNTRLIAEVSNSDASPEVLRAIYAKTRYPWIDYQIKLTIAEHRHVPKDVIEMIANSSDSACWLRVAANPATDAEVLEKLSNSKEFWVRASVARRDDCPDKLLEKLSADTKDVVRQNALAQTEKRKGKNENSKSSLQ